MIATGLGPVEAFNYLASEPAGSGRRFITVCIAALADEARAIVLVSDKALTYGGAYTPAIQGESRGIEKLLPIEGSHWVALISGDPTFAETVVEQVEWRLRNNPELGGSVAQFTELVKSEYQAVRNRAITDRVLGRRLLTADMLLNRPADVQPLPSSLFDQVAREIADFSTGCSLLIAGFDDKGLGRIFTVYDLGSLRRTMSQGSQPSALEPKARGHG
jgi:hypothetical protein